MFVVGTGELCRGEEFIPIVLVMSAERLQVRLEFLVDSLRLTVRLRVVRS